MAVKITSHIDGDILNRRHGRREPDGLVITVRGTCPTGAAVSVNGSPARVAGTEFAATVRLTEHQTRITASAGDQQDSILVLFDRHSFKRYRFSLDDNIWFLRDIASKQYKSIFENPYMALWRRLHDTYGTRFCCNIYYQCEGFDLTKMPDRYRGEWRDNGDWFHLTFHALQNEPAKLYLSAPYEVVARDYDLVVSEILRFAGEPVMDTFTTIHWGEATVDGCRAVRDRGIKGLCGYFVFDKGHPAVSYYLDAERAARLGKRDYWKDTREDIIFVRHAMVCNSGRFTPPRIGPYLDQIVANPDMGEVIELMIHEQYFHPGYAAYLPDYADRCEAAIRWAAENGYKPVFYNDGFVGAPL